MEMAKHLGMDGGNFCKIEKGVWKPTNLQGIRKKALAYLLPKLVHILEQRQKELSELILLKQQVERPKCGSAILMGMDKSIKRAVASAAEGFSVPEELIYGRSRNTEVKLARFAVIELVHERYKTFGLNPCPILGRSPAMLYTALRRVEEWKSIQDPVFMTGYNITKQLFDNDEKENIDKREN